MSDFVALHGFGGGSALNFDVRAYATEEAMLAATPRENTIGIVTDAAITGYTFSVTEPALRTGGLVWIMTGLFSTAPFTVTRRNSVMIYPAAVKQYVSGAWVVKTAKTYQDGEWIDWAQYLVKSGSLMAEHECSGKITITEGDGSLHVTCSSGNGAEYVTFRNVDMTGRTELKAEGTFSGNSGSSHRLCVWQNDQTTCTNNTALAAANLMGSSVIVSVEELTGLHKVGITCFATCDEYITDLYVS